MLLRELAEQEGIETTTVDGSDYYAFLKVFFDSNPGVSQEPGKQPISQWHVPGQCFIDFNRPSSHPYRADDGGWIVDTFYGVKANQAKEGDGEWLSDDKSRADENDFPIFKNSFYQPGQIAQSAVDDIEPGRGIIVGSAKAFVDNYQEALWGNLGGGIPSFFANAYVPTHLGEEDYCTPENQTGIARVARALIGEERISHDIVMDLIDTPELAWQVGKYSDSLSRSNLEKLAYLVAQDPKFAAKAIDRWPSAQIEPVIDIIINGVVKSPSLSLTVGGSYRYRTHGFPGQDKLARAVASWDYTSKQAEEKWPVELLAHLEQAKGAATQLHLF